MSEIVLSKADAMLVKELENYCKNTTKSSEMYKAAAEHVPGGIASDYQVMDPYPFYVKDSKESSIIDVDGNELLDFHGGFGVTLFGYKHPYLIAAAHKLFAEQGSLISLPTTNLLEASKLLSDRFSLPYWRFFNSGTEATLDAVRLARAKNCRKYIIKIESGYHGHHDAVWVSVHAGAREIGSDIPSQPFCSGIPKDVSDLTLIAEFNNLPSVQRYLDLYPGQVACVIVEPILLNCSMIKPLDGFLQKLIDLCRSQDVVVIFDLVKINTAIDMKHIEQFWDSEKCGPDMYTLGKGLSGKHLAVFLIAKCRCVLTFEPFSSSFCCIAQAPCAPWEPSA
jgi:glutamate-1-semialdehyde 2,1-aminomutase